MERAEAGVVLRDGREGSHHIDRRWISHVAESFQRLRHGCSQLYHHH